MKKSEHSGRGHGLGDSDSDRGGKAKNKKGLSSQEAEALLYTCSVCNDGRQILKSSKYNHEKSKRHQKNLNFENDSHEKSKRQHQKELNFENESHEKSKRQHQKDLNFENNRPRDQRDMWGTSCCVCKEGNIKKNVTVYCNKNHDICKFCFIDLSEKTPCCRPVSCPICERHYSTALFRMMPERTPADKKLMDYTHIELIRLMRSTKANVDQDLSEYHFFCIVTALSEIATYEYGNYEYRMEQNLPRCVWEYLKFIDEPGSSNDKVSQWYEMFRRAAENLIYKMYYSSSPVFDSYDGNFTKYISEDAIMAIIVEYYGSEIQCDDLLDSISERYDEDDTFTVLFDSLNKKTPDDDDENDVDYSFIVSDAVECLTDDLDILMLYRFPCDVADEVADRSKIASSVLGMLAMHPETWFLGCGSD